MTELSTAQALGEAQALAQRAADLVAHAAGHLQRPAGTGGVWLLLARTLSDTAAQSLRLAGDIRNLSDAVRDVSDMVRRGQPST